MPRRGERHRRGVRGLGDHRGGRPSPPPVALSALRPLHPVPLRHPVVPVDVAAPRPGGVAGPGQGELAAAVMTIDEIRKHLGATSLGYLSVEGATKSTGNAKGKFCLACFTGEYPLEPPVGLKKLEFEEPDHVGQIATVSTGQLRLIED